MARWLQVQVQGGTIESPASNGALAAAILMVGEERVESEASTVLPFSHWMFRLLYVDGEVLCLVVDGTSGHPGVWHSKNYGSTTSSAGTQLGTLTWSQKDEFQSVFGTTIAYLMNI